MLYFLLLLIFECISRYFIRFMAWPGRPGFNPRSSHTKDLKMVIDATLLYTQHYKVRIKGKVEHSRERSSVLPYAFV